MWANVLATAINAVMDYTLIFGHWGFPELGIRGAAIATIISSSVQILVYLALIARREYYLRYRTLAGWRFEQALFVRLVRFGLPNGVQFFFDMIGFSIFILLMGRLGTTPLAAANIALNVSILAFLPMIGIGIAVSREEQARSCGEERLLGGAHGLHLYGNRGGAICICPRHFSETL